MSSSPNIFSWQRESVSIPRGLPLIAGLTGVADSGGAVSGFTEYILDTLEYDIVGLFSADELLDYRARRPVIYFDQDHLTGFEPPRLALYLVKDELQRPFLLLTGYEPDFKWEAFASEIVHISQTLEISSMIWAHSIGMPVPHTRPIGTTVSGTRSDLIEQYSVWRPHTQVPSNAMHLVEYRLQENQHEVVGFVLLVPHYLAETGCGKKGVNSPPKLTNKLRPTRNSTGLSMPLRNDTTLICVTMLCVRHLLMRKVNFPQRMKLLLNLKNFLQYDVVTKSPGTCDNRKRTQSVPF